MEKELDGKVALVVGGTQHMGLAIAEAIAGLGAAVVVSYAHDAAAADRAVARLRQIGAAAEAVRADATLAADVERLFARVTELHGGVDIVVHTPGSNLKKPIVDTSDEEFDRTMNVNARSAFLTLRAAGRQLRNGGRYIVLSTTLAAIMRGPYGVYAGSKAVVEQMVKAAGQEFAARGITVNAVAPGPVDTPFYHGSETPDSIERAIAFNPYHRLGRTDDIAPVVAFLVSPGAHWITGQTIRPNGGIF